MNGPHPSHQTRISDASTFDEICINCGATDEVPGGWGALAQPCSNPPKTEEATNAKTEWILVSHGIYHPTYNHSREDSERVPCPLCAALKRVQELEQQMKVLNG